ncbi:hypothetical protein [Rhodoblastus sp.]|jgi:hypothetical protein|uniref:hypothetical protein n=1 Tax=Rhodoblastus sp. TaxID=1962975 RepID=UPI0025FBB0AA|nr:hypothetical protein [Rhodoblastus sp.]
MRNPVLLDNDIILKALRFGIEVELLSVATKSGDPPAILKVAEFMIRGRIQRSKLNGHENDEAALIEFLGAVARIEPSDHELELAADFEAKAQKKYLELDSGESQLLAALIVRGHKLMLTGDKRAICAIEQIASDQLDSARLVCFEQVVASILREADFTAVRESVCRTPTTDRAVSISFACSSAVVAVESVFEGLRSYTEALRRDAATVLFPGDDLIGVL